MKNTITTRRIKNNPIYLFNHACEKPAWDRLFAGGVLTMHRFLSLSVLLTGLFAAVSSYAAGSPQSAPMTEDSLGPLVEQPIEFPHDRHAGDAGKGGMQIDCMFCHTYARRGAVAGIPPLQKCIGCHQNIESVRETPRIKQLFEYWEGSKDGKIAARTPVPWKKVHDLPDFVRFNHERHIKRFNEQQNRPVQEVCGYCHGDVKEMTVARRSKALSMGWCAGCHEKDHPVTAEGGTPVGGQAYWYGFQKPEAAAASTGALKAKGPNDCWQCHK
ncbi:MAG: cytochrome c family protein [Gallionella sp.]|nr:cytochrome c family protein [Gallionella sp.]